MVNKVIPANMPHPMSAVGWDGTDFHILTIDAAGHLQVDNLSSALPTGAATAANQLTEITALQLIDDLRAALHSVNTDELQVNVEDSVLPTGAATAANQVTEIADLESMAPYDRALAKVVNEFVASLAAHGVTVRYTYTVPALHRGLIEAVYMETEAPSAGAVALLWGRVNGVRFVQCEVEPGVTSKVQMQIHWSGGIWLTAGDVFEVMTYSTSTANITFIFGTVVSEFDA